MSDCTEKKKMTALQDVKYITIHQKNADEYRFTLGASIIKHKEIWIVSYMQSLERENDSRSRVVCKYSFDNCKTWSDINIVVESDGIYSRSHGVFYSNGDKLWIFCPRAKFNSTAVFNDMDFVMESYLFDEKSLSWSFDGVKSSDAFWPLCEPLRLKNGSILIPGLECRGTHHPAVAISQEESRSFEMIVIPTDENSNTWGETTVIESEECLLAFVRPNSRRRILVSESYDFGKTWSKLKSTDMELIPSKLYSGVLKDGRKYLIGNIDICENGEKSNERKTLAISLFDSKKNETYKSFIIRHGYEKEDYRYAPQWSYPYAVEYEGFLYVVYTKHKWANELAVIPIESLK